MWKGKEMEGEMRKGNKFSFGWLRVKVEGM